MKYSNSIGSNANNFPAEIGNLSEFRVEPKVGRARYYTAPTESIEALFALTAESCETGDFTDAFLD